MVTIIVHCISFVILDSITIELQLILLVINRWGKAFTKNQHVFLESYMKSFSSKANRIQGNYFVYLILLNMNIQKH